MRYAYCFQQTVASPAVVEGLGYWSGKPVRVEFRPAAVDSGITFIRFDLESPIRIPAHIGNRIDMPLRTQLSNGSSSVAMVEHVLAALHGLDIDNCEVWVDAEEMPGCDGSSQAFVDAILSVGTHAQAVPRRYLTVEQYLRVEEGDAWVEARPPSGPGLKLQYHLDYGVGPIGEQELELLVCPDSFRHELAPARTFILEHEAQYLRENGLGTHCSYRDLLVFGKDGPIDNTLRFTDECVRHKTLDMVGDLALSGYRVMGDISASRSGHKLTADLVMELVKSAVVDETLRNIA